MIELETIQVDAATHDQCSMFLAMEGVEVKSNTPVVALRAKIGALGKSEFRLPKPVEAREANNTGEDKTNPQSLSPGEKDRLVAKIKINAPGPLETKDVFVGVNGQSYLIQRGVGVEVPYSVYEVLNNGVQNEYEPSEQGLGVPIARTSVQFSVLGIYESAAA